MTLEDIYFLAGIVASLGIIVSLIFVGLQIRQNTHATQSAAAQSVHSNFAGFYTSLQNNPDLLGITIKGLQEYDALTETEKAQMNSMFMAFNLNMQDAFYKFKDGHLAPEFWRSWELVSQNLFAAPGGKAFWADRGYLFANAYQEYINEDVMKRPISREIKPFGAFVVETDQADQGTPS